MKKLIIALIAAVTLTGAVYGAAASLSVTGTDQIGSGSEDVDAPSSVSNVAYTLDTGDISLVDAIDVTFTAVGGTGGTLNIQVVHDDLGGTISCGTVGSGSSIFQDSAAISDVATSASFGADLNLAASDIDCVAITITTS